MRLAVNQKVVGSNPTGGDDFFSILVYYIFFSFLTFFFYSETCNILQYSFYITFVCYLWDYESFVIFSLENNRIFIKSAVGRLLSK